MREARTLARGGTPHCRDNMIYSRKNAGLLRLAAKKNGEKYYFSGKPCKWGHSVERLTGTGACSVCIKNIMAKYEKAHPRIKKPRRGKIYTAQQLKDRRNAKRRDCYK